MVQKHPRSRSKEARDAIYNREAQSRPFWGFDLTEGSFTRRKKVAQGGQCEIYRCTGPDHTEVVLKVPRADVPAAAADLEQELLMLQLMHHPNIIALYGSGRTAKGATFLCLEFLSQG